MERRKHRNGCGDQPTGKFAESRFQVKVPSPALGFGELMGAPSTVL
jgi:hypothetical protein